MAASSAYPSGWVCIDEIIPVSSESAASTRPPSRPPRAERVALRRLARFLIVLPSMITPQNPRRLPGSPVRRAVGSSAVSRRVHRSTSSRLTSCGTRRSLP
jgi:hypothetical protein